MRGSERHLHLETAIQQSDCISCQRNPRLPKVLSLFYEHVQNQGTLFLTWFQLAVDSYFLGTRQKLLN